jgi:twitching motility protein PilI
MAERISLRDYQRDLAARLRGAAEAGRSSSKLAVQAGEEGWLVDLTEAGEVIPVPPITPVAQTRAWFKGVANVRGNLYSVVDFPAFLGGKGVALGEQSRLLLIAPRYRIGAALLVDSSLGLRNPEPWQPRQPAQAPAAWQRAEYEDESGKAWKELDVAELVRDANFLTVGS